MSRTIKIPLLVKIVISIILGIVCSLFFPIWLSRFFVTINSLFSNFLSFIIPLLIFGLIAPGIAELGKGAGKLLGITTLIAYGFTVLSGYFSYLSCRWVYPKFLNPDTFDIGSQVSIASTIDPFFTINIPPMMDITSSLIFAFIVGLSLTYIKGDTLKNCVIEFREIILWTIKRIIIPMLPIYIFGIFLKMGVEGSVASVIILFVKVILVIFLLHILLLLIQFSIAGIISKTNPLKSLKTMLPAYMTALGTQSSAATIPVTLAQAKKNGVDDDIADFVIPLCATIHLSGSTLKIVACAFAISFMCGMPYDVAIYTHFILMLGITMIAAPGVPGGAIMASLGLLSSILHFDANLQGLMIALYIAMDSFGTACNVTGDGSIALIINKIHKR